MTAKTIGSGTTLSAGYTITTADGNAFALTNNGVIGAAGGGYGVVVQTTGDFVFNSGKILANAASGKGVFSNLSVRVTNNTGGTIKAGYGIALYGGGSINNASGALITGLDPISASNSSVSVNKPPDYDPREDKPPVTIDTSVLTREERTVLLAALRKGLLRSAEGPSAIEG